MMLDMLFVALAHPLSPYIFSLNDRCKQLSQIVRAQTKEQLDPAARFVKSSSISAFDNASFRDAWSSFNLLDLVRLLISTSFSSTLLYIRFLSFRNFCFVTQCVGN